MGLFDDMEKMWVASPNDMDVQSVGSNGRACFGGGRCESGAGGGPVMLKQRWTELVRGYLAPRSPRYDHIDS